MMRRLLSGVLLLGFASMPGAAHAATSTTVAAINVVLPNGGAMTGAYVDVYYMPPNPADFGTLPLMGSGQTDSSGAVSIWLDTSMVDTANLGDTGTAYGPSAFNVDVVTSDPTGAYFDDESEVYQLNTTDTNVITAQSVSAMSTNGDGFTQTPDGQRPAAPPSVESGMSYESGSSCSTCQADRTEWPKVLVYNNANGMTSTFTYSKGESTEASVATSSCAVSSWCVGALALEANSRATRSSDNETGSFHYVMHAKYYFHELKFDHCLHGFCQNYYEWVIWKYRGQISDPDHGSGIYEAYDVPTFSKSHAAPLYANEQQERDTGQEETFGVSFDLGLNGQSGTFSSKAQYTSNTSLTWTGSTSGCSTTDWLWGVTADWNYTNIAQATCHA